MTGAARPPVERRMKMAVKILTESDFETEVLASPVPVLVDFWASWCGPCRMLSPVVEEIAEESDGSYAVGKINVDEQPGLAMRFGIMNIPTLLVFKNGEEVKRSIGVISKDEILSLID